MLIRRSATHFGLCLALMAALLRAALPVGVMPVFTPATGGISLAWCSSIPRAAPAEAHITLQSGEVQSLSDPCPFALAAAATLPSTQQSGSASVTTAVEQGFVGPASAPYVFPHRHPPARAPPSLS